MNEVHVVGAGLAGSEVAWQLVKRGHKVIIHEMKKIKKSPVHKSDYFAELVCSNSLKSVDLKNAEGLLKEEMKLFGSIILDCAMENKVPAGKALAVDREKFSRCVTERLLASGLVEVIDEEVTKPGENGIWVIATGPTTDGVLAEWVKEVSGGLFNFFDAVAPIISADSINMDICYVADRYGIGSGDYINCPMNKEQYEAFWEALVNAEVVEMKDFDRKLLFERCQPIEEIARSGKDAMRYGPLRPVGLPDPKTGKEPYAVVQLRKENVEGTMYNLVGFQTRLKWGEQLRVIRMIPGLENAEILRYGVMHRNSYIDSPRVLDRFLRLKRQPNIFFAGQITGVEGYVESAMTGLYVGLNVARLLEGKEMVEFPKKTMCGALIDYITTAEELKPMYANFGLLGAGKNREKAAERALSEMKSFVERLEYNK
ncbi:MAG: methylenetetrahydrofolate--tRNA-(uracil(54)-C(5))-methyltransferase (FADH(2)-oxidizing) TrmFO [Fervidobacterium sp.]|uniref:Methylenetetrahydrofolate--tRNA-(uracil-5-)-methyltransferase TrmFO n=1 Tax=Fervidobacterium pennivorans TaxID=93466 RepID=A0A172T5H7_FERPE|nr:MULTISPECIES: methylenetetrahydrofolate--tRNA-(uracil(54)-C(5))-methyltransferase (FADH(2)-oxidizing) TrmFO [Fervidobacterium]ANE42278.1 tRNA (uracil-5-)-methyltransferase [Fervidobacterium pennivorans]NPU90184.1 methylenetetrahydrofolate--tRNA-(uracil(54)-C(5))-methyltransferase (FADH(2)-oxidizing) TrmFO [Fervidobacterium sp.]